MIKKKKMLVTISKHYNKMACEITQPAQYMQNRRLAHNLPTMVEMIRSAFGQNRI